MSPWILAALVLAIVLFFIACVLVSAVAAFAAWKVSKLDAPIKSIAESLDALRKPFVECVPVLEDARDAVAEVKGIQEGTTKLLREVVLSVKTLATVVESFENSILPPEKRTGAPGLPPTETDEIILERRIKARENQAPQNLKDIGKFVGTS